MIKKNNICCSFKIVDDTLGDDSIPHALLISIVGYFVIADKLFTYHFLVIEADVREDELDYGTIREEYKLKGKTVVCYDKREQINIGDASEDIFLRKQDYDEFIEELGLLYANFMFNYYETQEVQRAAEIDIEIADYEREILGIPYDYFSL